MPQSRWRLGALNLLVVAAVLLLAVGGAPERSRAVPGPADGCIDDPYERDNYCSIWGHNEVRVGETQMHLHCDEDWVFVRPLEGASYVIETSNLAGGADTMLELWIGDSQCTDLLVADDDGGEGPASRIQWQARNLDPYHNYFIKVSEADEVYGDGRGYDLSLGCADRCRTWFVPLVMHRDGMWQTTTVSEVEVFNPGDDSISVDLHFTPTGMEGPYFRLRAELEVGAGETVRMEDVVGGVFGGVGEGSLEIDAHGEEVVVASRTRTSNLGNVFSYGGYVPALRRDRAGDAFGELEAFLISKKYGVVTDLVLCETTGSAVTVSLTLYTAGSGGSGRRTVQLVGFEHRLIEDVVGLFGLDALHAGRVEVAHEQGSGRVLAAALVRDLLLGDVMLVPDALEGLRSFTQVVPVAAAADGASGSRWLTDLWIANIHGGMEPLQPRVAFVPAGGMQQPEFTVLSVAPREVLVIEDVVTALGGSGSGALLIEDTWGLEVRSRTYNVGGALTWGQLVPSHQLTDALGAGEGPLVALGLRGSDGFRSNAGFFNPTAEPGSVEVRLYSAVGDLLGRRGFEIGPWHQHQVNDVFRALGVEAEDPARLEVDVVGGRARILAYASVIHNNTGDPTYAPARPVTRSPGPVLLDNRENAVLVDQLSESVGIDELPPGEYSLTVSGSGHLGDPGLPLAVVCLFKNSFGDLRAASLGLGESLDGVGGSHPLRCFIPDWRNRDDNVGGARVTLTSSTATLAVDLDARENCVLVDQLPAAVTQTEPAGSYVVRSSGDLGRPGLQPAVLVLRHHRESQRLVSQVHYHGSSASGVYEGSPLVAVVLDWIRADDNTGVTLLDPGWWRGSKDLGRDPGADVTTLGQSLTPGHT